MRDDSMNVKKILLITPLAAILSSAAAMAHCPLCTVGAATVAGGAVWIGVDKVVVGLFLGAFAASMGWWFSRLIKKQYVPFQKWLIILLSFITTIIPILPVVGAAPYPIHISVAGSYGSLLNRIYLLNLFLVGSILGAIIVSIAPWLSSSITRLRKEKTLPFQGSVLTLLLLVITGVVLQLVL